MTQKEKIIKYMKTHKRGITSMDAFRFGCTRLSGQIFTLRKNGYDIVTEQIAFKNEYGTGYCARYVLKSEPVKK